MAVRIISPLSQPEVLSLMQLTLPSESHVQAVTVWVLTQRFCGGTLFQADLGHPPYLVPFRAEPLILSTGHWTLEAALRSCPFHCLHPSLLLFPFPSISRVEISLMTPLCPSGVWSSTLPTTQLSVLQNQVGKNLLVSQQLTCYLLSLSELK